LRDRYSAQGAGMCQKRMRYAHCWRLRDFNDVSERAFQTESGGQWVKGKSCDSFAPIGPYLVTADDVPDPQNIDFMGWM